MTYDAWPLVMCRRSSPLVLVVDPKSLDGEKRAWQRADWSGQGPIDANLTRQAVRQSMALSALLQMAR